MDRLLDRDRCIYNSQAITLNRIDRPDNFQMVQAIQVLRFHLLELEKVSFVFYPFCLVDEAVGVLAANLTDVARRVPLRTPLRPQ
jgi:hypothetical protein